MSTVSRMAFACLLAACSSSSTSASATHPSGSNAAPPHDAAISHTVGMPGGPTPTECSALFAHAVALRMAELQRTLPPDRLPTDTDQAQLRGQLENEHGHSCRKGTRESYACGIAAKTLADFEACP